MTFDQIALFGLFGLVLVLLIWGRLRYDLVAFGALVVAVLLGIISIDNAFAGFGHPATIIVALVFIISRGLSNSGAIDWLSRKVINQGRSISSHIAVMGGLGAALSAFMNNVAALTLLMPVEIAAAAKNKRPPAATLMPLSFATILGGLITLIGTPPNIIISQFRADATGEPFMMFDFAPVGLAVAIAGVTFIALVGWRLIPTRAIEANQIEELRRITDYMAELSVPEGADIIGKLVMELDEAADETDAVILGLVRKGRRLPGRARTNIIRPGDVLVVEGTPESLDKLKIALQLEFFEPGEEETTPQDNLALIEAVVQPDSQIIGRSAQSFRLTRRHGVVLLGISRRGRRIAGRVRQERIEAGDILLLIGTPDQLADEAAALGLLSLAPRAVAVGQAPRAGLAAGIFAAVIVGATVGLFPIAIALAIAALAYIAIGIVPPKEVYSEINWPVVVLIGALIPLGLALESTGGTEVIADLVLSAGDGLPAVLILLIVMMATMALTDVINNSAAAVVVAPVAIEVARRLGVSPDPFLIGVAIAASSAFLTPIGHHNNTLVMGPGGYSFGDYWRMGLPLEVVILAVSIPMILIVWPF
jgi:di/tricarboxylate transporter